MGKAKDPGGNLGPVGKIIDKAIKIVAGKPGAVGQTTDRIYQRQNQLDAANEMLDNTSPQETPAIQKIFEK